MTAFLALVRKDLQLYLADRRALLLHVLMPVALAAFFGYLFGGSGPRETGKIDIAVVQQDAGPVAERISAGLAADSHLRVQLLALEAAREQVRKGKLKLAVVIPAGFGEAAGAALFNAGAKPQISLLYDPSETMVLAMVKGLLSQQVMQNLSNDMFNGAGGKKLVGDSLGKLAGRSDSESQAARQLLGALQDYQQRPTAAAGQGVVKGMSEPFSTHEEAVQAQGAVAGYNGYAHSFAGMSVQFILFMGIDMGIAILLAQRSGIWQRLLAAPISLRLMLLARLASATLIAGGLLAVVFAIAVLGFGVRISNPLGFALVGGAFAVFTACFGLLIAAFGKTPEAARGLAVFATLLMVMLSGAWAPSFIFPAWLQQATLVIPTRWAVDGLDAMTWRGLGLDAAVQSAAVQLGFALAFGALALWRFRATLR